MESKNKVLEKKDITRLAFDSLFLQASFNYERMQAGGFLVSQLPALKKIYKDDKEGLAASMRDNLEFINTHPNLVGFLMGLLISMEEAGEDRNTIKGLKVALFAPFGMHRRCHILVHHPSDSCRNLRFHGYGGEHLRTYDLLRRLCHHLRTAFCLDPLGL